MLGSPYIHPYLQVKPSRLHGLGVFTAEALPQNIIVERCGIIDTDQCSIQTYCFGWPQNQTWECFVIALGYGSYYNHSDTPNVKWSSDIASRVMVFQTLRDIRAGEELCTNYGPSYWGNIEPNKQ